MQAVGKEAKEDELGFVAKTSIVWVSLNTSSRTKAVIFRTEGARDVREKKENSFS